MLAQARCLGRLALGAFLVLPRLAAAQTAAPNFNPRAIAGIAGYAFFFALAAWGCAAIADLLRFALGSDDEFRDVVLAALRASVPAMWLAPAILLLATLQPWFLLMGLLLVANTVRLLLARNFLRVAASDPSLGRWRKSRRTGDPVFHFVDPLRGKFSHETLPSISGALATQLGIGTALFGFPLVGAVLVSVGVTVWTLASISRGAYAERKAAKPAMESILSITLTLLFATFLSLVTSVVPGGVSGAALPDTAHRVWQRLLSGVPDDPPLKKSQPNVAHLVAPRKRPAPPPEQTEPAVDAQPATEGVPGVLLQAESKAHRQKLSPVRFKDGGAGLYQPYSFPFTGDYRLFPAVSQLLRKDWVIDSGSPLAAVYETARGAPVETQAEQPLDPPMDLSNCAVIQLRLRSDETQATEVVMLLASASGITTLEPAAIGLSPRPRELLDFVLPQGLALPRVLAVRIYFHHVGGLLHQSARVEIESFTLLPR